MAVTCQDVLTRAIALSDSNTGFSQLAPAELLNVLNQAQGALFTRLAQDNRTYYLTVQSLISSNAVSLRTADLGSLVPSVERVLKIFLPTGEELNIVDVQDQSAELSPRAFPYGTLLKELANDWSAAPGPVTLTIWYVYHPALLDLAGALTQALTVPDQFSSYFDYHLAWYFAEKDTGRIEADPGELDRLAAMKEAAYQNIVQFLDHFNGVAARRFNLPVPTTDEKK